MTEHADPGRPGDVSADRERSDARPTAGPLRPRIGVTLMTDTAVRDDHVPRYGMNRVYFEAIRRAGGVPIPLAPGPPREMDRYLVCEGEGGAQRPFLDALCLSGGGDPDAAFFGQATIPQCKDPDLERDHAELHLLRLAREIDLPILGICRGIQMMNIARGGDLIQDIASTHPDALKHDYWNGYPRDHLAHEIRIAEQSLLHELIGSETLMVNSLHHQAVGRLGEGLAATAWAADGIIEAIELDPQPSARESGAPFLLGVQFHPEDLLARAQMRRIFEALVEAARGFHNRRSVP